MSVTAAATTTTSPSHWPIEARRAFLRRLKRSVRAAETALLADDWSGAYLEGLSLETSVRRLIHGAYQQKEAAR